VAFVERFFDLISLVLSLDLGPEPQAEPDLASFGRQVELALEKEENQPLAGLTPKEAEAARLALWAFIDERILTSRRPDRSLWAQSPLVRQRLGGTHGGDLFYLKLAGLLMSRREYLAGAKGLAPNSPNYPALSSRADYGSVADPSLRSGYGSLADQNRRPDYAFRSDLGFQSNLGSGADLSFFANSDSRGDLSSRSDLDPAYRDPGRDPYRDPRRDPWPDPAKKLNLLDYDQRPPLTNQATNGLKETFLDDKNFNPLNLLNFKSQTDPSQPSYGFNEALNPDYGLTLNPRQKEPVSLEGSTRGSFGYGAPSRTAEPTLKSLARLWRDKGEGPKGLDAALDCYALALLLGFRGRLADPAQAEAERALLAAAAAFLTNRRPPPGVLSPIRAVPKIAPPSFWERNRSVIVHGLLPALVALAVFLKGAAVVESLPF
jgi:type VI protein secretion system component VasF